MARFVAWLARFKKAIVGGAAGLLALVVTVPTDLLPPKVATWVMLAVAVLGVIAGPANAPKPEMDKPTGQ